MNYIKEFDALRAIAVILVIVSHWTPKNIGLLLPVGNIGVDIFFVLSGFLITKILLVNKSRIEAEDSKESKFKAIVNFMFRRSLRIFPLYYLMILILYLGANYLPNPIPTDWKYYVLYMQNFLFYFNQSFPGGKLSHFWSLAVEEQFYLFWPWVLFFVTQKHIKNVLISGMIIGTIASLLFPFLPGKELLTPVLTICCLQAFCFGGLLSYWSAKGSQEIENNYCFLKVIAFIVLIIYFSIKFLFPDLVYIDRILIATVTTFILTSILLNKIKGFEFLLKNKILISIGKVSYGIYIFHPFIPISLSAILYFMKQKTVQTSEMHLIINHIENNLISFYGICLIILLSISYFSFYFFETPFLKLKKFF